MFTEIRFRDFREQYPGFLPGVLLILAVLLAIDLLLFDRRENYTAEIEALRANMTQEQQQRGDAMSVSRQEQQKLMLELVRRQARYGTALHLSVDLDSSKMILMQEGAVLRTIPVELGAARSLRSHDTASSVIRGADSVVRVLGPADPWPVPRWVYQDRRLAVPADSEVAGALGPVGVLLGSGTVIYALPASGPLRDPAYVLPGAIRASVDDLRAIAPNLVPGTPVYIY
jgi:hypothetical protein